MIRALPEAFLRAPYACGWKDRDGAVQLAWGENPEAAEDGLEFRDFFLSSSMHGPWRAFPARGFCRPEHRLTLDALPRPELASLPFGPGDDEPNLPDWNRFCTKIEAQLHAGTLQKAVPARSRILSLSPADASRLRAELPGRLFSGPANGTFRFFLSWEGSVFFGATPELLFRREGEGILVPAIAGTRLRPKDPSALAATEAELLADPKERAEHALVVRGIREALSSLGLRPESPAEPEILPLRHLLHLYTPVHAAHGGIGAEPLVSALHPTPAIGGYPKHAAWEFLRENEPFPRGLFASPLLFRFGGRETCLVAIRSALLAGNKLRFFAGAGYVPGSTTEGEWDETGKKMDSLKALLEEERFA